MPSGSTIRGINCPPCGRTRIGAGIISVDIISHCNSIYYKIFQFLNFFGCPARPFRDVGLVSAAFSPAFSAGQSLRAFFLSLRSGNRLLPHNRGRPLRWLSQVRFRILREGRCLRLRNRAGQGCRRQTAGQAGKLPKDSGGTAPLRYRAPRRFGRMVQRSAASRAAVLSHRSAPGQVKRPFRFRGNSGDSAGFPR